MRVGLWCGVAALALLTIASALRTSQVEGASRGGRQLSPSSEFRIENAEAEDEPTFRPRTSSRRKESPSIDRTRSRSRQVAEVDEQSRPLRNENFDSRRTNTRTRYRGSETETSSEIPNRESSFRSRSPFRERQRSSQTNQSQQTIHKKDDTKPGTTISYLEVTSSLPNVKVTTPRVDTTSQFKRRSSTSPVTESSRATTRRRGRINTRIDTKALDLAVSSTTNTLTISNKESNFAKTQTDLRNSRKLRYKQRLSETDTNLTGEGITLSNEVTKSSQTKENITSQPEIQTETSAIETTVQVITESPKVSSSTKATKIVRRPLSRGKVNFRPISSSPKKSSDEISEDDNYPASFKAKLQAKNVKTQPNSPTSESLSVKASQKVFNTYTTSPQTTHSGPAQNKYLRFRSKIKTEESQRQETKLEDIDNEETSEVNVSTKKPTQSPEFKLKSTYRARTINHNSSSSDQSSEKPSYKYNRKFKPSTTEIPKIESTSKFKRLGTNTLLKNTHPRPSYYSRRYSNKSMNASSETTVVSSNDNVSKDSNVTFIKTLPRTSYYSRFRGKSQEVGNTTSTEVYSNTNIHLPSENKSENSADMPMFISLFENSSQSETANIMNREEPTSTKEPEREKQMFIIAVSSKESFENSTENEVPSKIGDVEEKPIIYTVPPKPTYSANFKDNIPDVSQNKDKEVHVPKNIHSRKHGRRRPKPEFNEEESLDTTVKPKEKHVRKFTDAYTKTTEPSTNGIPPEPEKQRSRYSSKYRAAYLDKPYYKPTVPTITPSTAWLKFFVTDPQLAKSVEEPKWFDGEDIFITTEMTRQNTAPSVSHESSLELVEGEEFQIGPDINAIAFTKTRSTLSSADLRISESLEKASHVMNVETLQHSPSVTVSIFDALAEILTSTPRTPRLSSTTEVQKQNINDIQTLDGVSNSITVNNVKHLTTQETLTTVTDLNTSTKFVQTVAQTTPNVINSQLETITLSLNNIEADINPVNTPNPFTPTPTTPVSARRPFAVKVLYTETEPTSDKSTITEPKSTSQPSNDISEMVHNTVSDFLLANNHLVSSELTSMLSNNIKNVIQNMDEKTKSKISVDMAKLLKTIIPRALVGLTTVNDDKDSAPNTTPYTLEDIRDTENLKFDIVNSEINGDKNDIRLSESLQSVVTDRSVNSGSNVVTTPGETETPSQAVNSDQSLVSNTSFILSSQTTLADFNLPTISSVTLQPTTIINNSESATSSDFSVTEVTNVVGNGNRASVPFDSNTNNIPLPFFSNFKVKDFTATTVDITSSTEASKLSSILIKSTSTVKSTVLSQENANIQGIQDENSVSPLQLWVLNKKARVLQMIEDLIREHNNEIATYPPLTDMINLSSNIPLSNRLTEILNTMSSTTDPSTSVTSLSTPIPINDPALPFTTLFTQADESQNSGSSFLSLLSTTEATVEDQKTTSQSPSDIFSRLSFTETNDDSTQEIKNTTPTIASEELEELSSTTSEIPTTTEENITTQTSVNAEEILINTDLPSITTVDLTIVDSTTTDAPSINETTENITSAVKNQVNISNEPPKKDYVIFGILPNNTVVRKDPNDDILETLTEASPYIIYSLLPNNTVIRRFPNGTRVPRLMQKIDVLPISPSSLRNPYSPIHNNPAIVRPHNPIRVSTNNVTSTDTSNNGSENRLTNDTVNNQQQMIPTTLNIKDSSLMGITTATNKLPAEKSTASHVLSLRTSTMLPSIDEILLNSISSAVKEEMVISSMMSSTREPTILTLDIDPETKQIRTERPNNGSEGTIFKFIPIDEVTVAPQGTNVLKLATKAPSTLIVTEVNTQVSQIQTHQSEDSNIPTTTMQITVGTPLEMNSVAFTKAPSMTSSMPFSTIALTTMDETTTTEATTMEPKTVTITTTTPAPTTTSTTPVQTTTTTTFAPVTTTTTMPVPITTTTSSPTTDTPAPTTPASILISSTIDIPTSITILEDKQFQDDSKFLQSLLSTERSPKSLNTFSTNNQISLSGLTSLSSTTTKTTPSLTQLSEEAKIVQAILQSNNQRTSTVSIPNLGTNLKTNTGTTPSKSIEDDIRQFEEDTKLLKALLAATGQNPASLNIPSLESFGIPTKASSIPTTSPRPIITTTIAPTTTQMTTTPRLQTSTQLVSDDLQKLREDAQLLQALLQATGRNTNDAKPIVSAVTSSVRISSDPSMTSVTTKPTTAANVHPVYTSRTTTSRTPIFTTLSPVLTTFQLQELTTKEGGISSTIPPKQRRKLPTTTIATARRAPSSRFTMTTEIPSTSTFSDEEDLQFLRNLKTVLVNNPNDEDPEAALANRIIALAVERSLNEIESGKQANVGKTGITTITTPVTRPTTTTSTSTTTTTTTIKTTTAKDNTPSLDEDIKRFQEDTKLLQALLKATGQDPSQFNIPTLPPNINSNTNVSSKIPSKATDDLKILSNLIASPSPLNESIEILTEKTKPTTSTTPRPFGARIIVKDQLKNENDDAKLLQTLIKLQGVTETTTQKSKLAITGQSPDEALQKLIQRTKPPNMVSEATKTPMSVSTEYGKSNDALLAALLKEQGFGPTTASSIDEQLRLAALLNQVVVTPKSRRVTTPPPPPPPPPAPQRRPILDGLAWLWQQWRETDPGRPAARPNRRPVVPASGASPSSPPVANRLPWFGSGPFVGNADEQPSSNRVPLEPPRVVTSEQAPGRGQLVSAAINVTRAFSQFLGAAIAGAAQTVQSVIRAGQRAATDVYSTGSG